MNFDLIGRKGNHQADVLQLKLEIAKLNKTSFGTFVPDFFLSFWEFVLV